MKHPLMQKHIVLGVTGSIASYKSVELASLLTKAGAFVDVLMTPSAVEFVSPLTFQSITHREVITDIFAPRISNDIGHVTLAERADLMIVAPATANTIGKLAHGLGDDPVTTTALGIMVPLIIAPAMDLGMWANLGVQANVTILKERGTIFVEPNYGRLASGLIGQGRLVEPIELLSHITKVLGRQADLAGRSFVVSAGGTQEPLDPVRALTNRSSGKMGYAIAEAARDRGAEVTLVTAPTALPDPIGIKIIQVRTAQEMEKALLEACVGQEVLVMAAAVADYRPTNVELEKRKRESGEWLLLLSPTVDILSKTSPTMFRVGFAAETTNLKVHAAEKLKMKGVDLLIGNDVSRPGSEFGSDTNQVIILHASGEREELPLLPKYQVAHEILNRVAQKLNRSP